MKRVPALAKLVESPYQKQLYLTLGEVYSFQIELEVEIAHPNLLDVEPVVTYDVASLIKRVRIQAVQTKLVLGDLAKL